MSFDRMLNQVMVSVTASDDEMVFETESGNIFTFCHLQDCCEHVYIEDISGDLNDLVGAPMLIAEEVSNLDGVPDIKDTYEEYQWTFYKFGTNKGYVTVRWLGSSNGYYGTEVSCLETKRG